MHITERTSAIEEPTIKAHAIPPNPSNNPANIKLNRHRIIFVLDEFLISNKELKINNEKNLLKNPKTITRHNPRLR